MTVGRCACVHACVRACVRVCDGGGYLFCSFKDSRWEFAWVVALFWLRLFNCLIIPFVPISRGGMLEYNEGSITGLGNISLVNTEVNCLLRVFALTRSFVVVYHLLSEWECQCFLVCLP